MFVIVDAKEGKELTLIEKWRYWKGFLSEESLFDLPVTVLHCQKKEGALVKKQVAKFTRSRRAAAVVPDDTQIPEDCGLFLHSPKRYELALCEDFLLQFSRILTPERRTIRIKDRYAKHPELVRRMARYYRTVGVLTQFPGCYEKLQEEILEESGAAVLVSQSESLLSGCPIQLNYGKEQQVVIAGVPVERYYGESEEEIAQFLHHRNLNLDAGRVAAALFEDAAGRRKIRPVCTAIQLHGQVILLRELCDSVTLPDTSDTCQST